MIAVNKDKDIHHFSISTGETILWQGAPERLPLILQTVCSHLPMLFLWSFFCAFLYLFSLNDIHIANFPFMGWLLPVLIRWSILAYQINCRCHESYCLTDRAVYIHDGGGSSKDRRYSVRQNGDGHGDGTIVKGHLMNRIPLIYRKFHVSSIILLTPMGAFQSRQSPGGELMELLAIANYEDTMRLFQRTIDQNWNASRKAWQKERKEQE